MKRIRLGISACLLGEKVRYDGTHKLIPVIQNIIGQHVDFVLICPEVECGLPIPREPLQLEGDSHAPRLVTVRTKKDLTKKITSWANMRIESLKNENLDGFILKSNSPSCGLQGVKIYNHKNTPHFTGMGLFTSAFIQAFPLLPVEEGEQLIDPSVRARFLQRIKTQVKYY